MKGACYISIISSFPEKCKPRKGYFSMKNLYNQLEQAEKEMPINLKLLITSYFENPDFFRHFSEAIMKEELSDTVSQKYNRDRAKLDILLTEFCEWQDISDTSKVYEVLIALIYEYQHTAFRAGFKAAQELLK